ncbi:MAG TPA: tyrosine-type recombinase/integrase [Longimicrobium sp.]|nr:tyrosine-type recombinase/integrase [Longimicrobium sp.]
MAPKRRQKPRRKTQAPIAERLVERMRSRADSGGTYTLDLRGKAWGGIRPDDCAGFLTLRDPADAGWPKAGQTTTSAEVAEAWVRGRYAEWLGRREETARGVPGSSPTVEEACRKYLRDAEKRLGFRHNTVVNRRSVCDVHLIPAFGPIPLDALSKPQVRTFLEELRVRKWKDGVFGVHPASLRSKANVRAALHAVWNDAFPDDDKGPPFAGIRLRKQSDSRSRREAALAGSLDARSGERAYTRDEILRLLASAMRFDLESMSLPHNVALYFANTAAGMALLLGTNARIEESTFLRWKHIRREAHAIYIPGTKSSSAPRWVPLLESLVPWLTLLEEISGGPPDPEDFVLRLRRKAKRVQPSKKTWGARIARVETLAGLKMELKAAHILRATNLSLAKDRLPEAALKSYAGHHAPRGGATDAYIDLRPPFIPPEHRTYLELPSPEEVREHLERVLLRK